MPSKRKPTKTLKKAIQQNNATPKKKSSNNSDKASDRAGNSHLRISPHRHVIYLLLTKGYLDQTQVAEKLGLRRQTVNFHAKRLELVGLIEPIDPNGNPKFYKPTPTTPVVSGSATPVVSESAKKMERTVGKTPRLVKDNKTGKIKVRKSGRKIEHARNILVRDHKTGKIKGWKSGRKIGNVRDYNTIVSVDGKRIPMLRVHSIAYTCTILRGPLKEVPWKPAEEGMKGMEQFVYRHIFDNKKSAGMHPVLFNLKKIEVTFLRQKTKGTDELIIYMPEKYFFEYELEQGEAILKNYVWAARKWFQNTFKVWLGLALPYRDMEIAHEIFDPAMRRWVQENGMAKIQTKRGRGIVDESKKGFPEREFTTIEQVKADLESGDRILDLEEQMRFMMEQQSQLMIESAGTSSDVGKIIVAIQTMEGKQMQQQSQLLKLAEDGETSFEMQNKMMGIQDNMTTAIQTLGGKYELMLSRLLKLAGDVKTSTEMQNDMLKVVRELTERCQMGKREKHLDSNIDT